MTGGFGVNDFGNINFGNTGWSKTVLFDLLPELYKNADTANDNYLEKYSESIGASFDELKTKIENFTDLRDPELVQTQYQNLKRLKLGRIIEPKGAILQRGIDGTVNSLGEFRSSSVKFTNADLGRDLYISRSSIASNNRKVKIISIITNKIVKTEPSLATTASVFRWELRERVFTNPTQQIIEIRGGDVSNVATDWTINDGQVKSKIIKKNIFNYSTGIKENLTEKEGFTGSVDSAGRFRSNTYNFTGKDIGKFFTIANSEITSNNGKYEVLDVDVISPTDVRAVVSRINLAGSDINGNVSYSVNNGFNNIKIKHLRSGTNTVLTVEIIDDTNIVVNLATDYLGAIISTASEVTAIVNNDVAASEIITATASGTGLSLVNEYDFADPINGILLQDAGPLTWALLPYAQMTVKKNNTLLGVITQEGIDLTINGNVISSPTSIFQNSSAVNKIITISGSAIASNNGSFEIITVTSNNIAIINKTLTTEAPLLCWEIRNKTELGNDQIQVEINAPSFIFNLGQEFDLNVDEVETELRQRNFVNNFNQWVDKKGHSSAYSAIGEISGFDVEAFPLYRITRDIALNTDFALNVIQAGESGSGRSGTDGSILYLASGDYKFYAPTAKFKTTDIDSVLRLDATANVVNNSLFTIKGYISETEALLDPYEGMVEDGNNTTIDWAIIRLYSNVIPTIPNFDEINTDLFTELVGTGPDYPEFTIDKFCYEPDMIDFISVTINTDPLKTKFIATNRLQITLTGEMDVVIGIGNWYIEDNAGNQFYLETLPVETIPASGIYTVEAISTILPGAGGLLKYSCPVPLICVYCPASKIYLTIEMNGILNDPLKSFEKVLERLLQKFKQVKPIHVSILPRYIQPLNVNFGMSVTINTGLIIQELQVSFGAYYDYTPADALPGDTQIFVEIEVP